MYKEKSYVTIFIASYIVITTNVFIDSILELFLNYCKWSKFSF